MGQCPSNFDFAQDDEIIIGKHEYSNPKLLCHARRFAYPRREPQTKMTFLKLHKVDRQQKCIINPTEIASSLQMQADNNMTRPREAEEFYYTRASRNTHRAQAKYGISDQTVASDSQSVVTTCLSDYAPSQYTSATLVTVIASNKAAPAEPSKRKRQRYSSLIPNKQRTLKEKERAHDCQPSGMDSEGYIKQGGENYDDLSTDAEQYLRTQQMVLNKYKGILMGCVQPANDEGKLTRDAFMSVLHLEMQASLGPYYCKRYLPMFPNCPAPHGFPRNKMKSLPDVDSSDSDSSSMEDDETHVGFGTMPPCKPVTLSSSEEVFMDLAVAGSLGLVPRTINQFSSGSQTNPIGSDLKSPDQYLILMNRRSGSPLAICALKASDGPPIVRIYASKPRVKGQLPAANTKNLGLVWSKSFPLYTWAEVVTDEMDPQNERSTMYMASGSDGRFSSEPSYVASSSVEDGSWFIRVLGRTERESRYTGCALLSLESLECGSANILFKLDIAYGIDPALMICFTAIMDEILEKSMRSSYKEKLRRVGSSIQAY